MSNLRRIGLGLIALATAWGVVSAGDATARAAVSFAAEVEPDSISFPWRGTVTYKLRMTSDLGLGEERFSVNLRPPQFAEGGSPVGIAHLPENVSLTPPGRIGHVQTQQAMLLCMRSGAYGPLGATFDLYLPRGTSAVLSARFQTGHAAPFPDTDYRVTFGVSRSMLEPGQTGTLDHDETVVTPGPRRTGKTGVLMRLRSTPPGLLPTDPLGASPPPDVRARIRGKVRRGQTVVFRGTTDPVLRRQRLVLRYRGGRGASPPPMRTLAVVRTDDRGRFRAVWKPRIAGPHEVWAVYRTQRPDIVSDQTGCPLTYEVR